MTALSHTPHVRMRTWELLRIMPHVLRITATVSHGIGRCAWRRLILLFSCASSEHHFFRCHAAITVSRNEVATIYPNVKVDVKACCLRTCADTWGAGGGQAAGRVLRVLPCRCRLLDVEAEPSPSDHCDRWLR